jgi:hypothetical protein
MINLPQTLGRGFLKKPDSGFFEITKAGRITRLDL